MAQCCVMVLASVSIARSVLGGAKNHQYRAASMPFRNSYDWNEIVPLSRWIAGDTPSDAVLVGNSIRSGSYQRAGRR